MDYAESESIIKIHRFSQEYRVKVGSYRALIKLRTPPIRLAGILIVFYTCGQYAKRTEENENCK